jgi:hypothetical protein
VHMYAVIPFSLWVCVAVAGMDGWTLFLWLSNTVTVPYKKVLYSSVFAIGVDQILHQCTGMPPHRHATRCPCAPAAHVLPSWLPVPPFRRGVLWSEPWVL